MQIKKLTAALCALAMAVSLAACGGTDKDSGKDKGSADNDVTAAAATEKQTEKQTEKATEAKTEEAKETEAETTETEEETTTEAETEPVPDEFVKYAKNYDYIYEIYTRHIEISEYIGDGGEVVIPEEIDDLPVTVLGSGIFDKEHDKGVTKVTLPSGLKMICTGVFGGCTSLTEINIPKCIEKIGENAFAETPWLETAPKAINGIKIHD